MSRHVFHTACNDEPITILMGWDKPLQGYFMVIYKSNDIDEPFYSNLYEKESHPKTLATFLKILEINKINIPKEMTYEVIQDAEKNIGNRDVTHYISGDIYARKQGIEVEF